MVHAFIFALTQIGPNIFILNDAYSSNSNLLERFFFYFHDKANPLIKEQEQKRIIPHDLIAIWGKNTLITNNVEEKDFLSKTIEKEFAGFIIKKKQTVSKTGLMHNAEYLRVTHAFIMQKKLSDTQTAASTTETTTSTVAKKF